MAKHQNKGDYKTDDLVLFLKNLLTLISHCALSRYRNGRIDHRGKNQNCI